LAALRWASACLLGTAVLGCGREFVEPAQMPQALAMAPEALARGTQLLAQGQPREASEVFRSVLETDPTSSTTRLVLAQAEVRQGDLASAQRHLEEVLGLAAQRDDLVEALSGLADIRHRLGDEQGARDDLAQAEALRASPAEVGAAPVDSPQETRPILR
jgi:Tfp pilus assembly protein PilF